MPSPVRVLRADEAARFAAERGFGASGGRATAAGRVGLEMEWCTVDLARPHQPADFAIVRTAAAGARLPHHSAISYEPGGQIELSTAPLPGLDAVRALTDDAHALGRSLARAGIGMVAIGLEPGPRRERCLASPRYDAMEQFFDAGGEAGRTMMRSTAALQVNLDLAPVDEPGDPGAAARRWQLANSLGPLLAAMFANSPFWNGRPSGWRSTRLAVWHAIDDRRTRPVGNGTDCRTAWARYALDADVMLVRSSDDEHVALPPGTSFADWIEQGHTSGWPTADDLGYHLTTLFPPVRPRGWLELRMIDALPAPWWSVAAAVSTVLVDDPDAARCAALAIEPVRGRWTDAARTGLADAAFARAAQTCMKAARAVLPRAGAGADLVDAAAEFDRRFVARGRTPADDLLDAFREHETLLPSADNA
jgi:glutamate--cysteine ligase